MKRLIPIIILWISSAQLQGQNTVGTILNDSLSLQGYTLFSPSTSTFLIDNCGHIINQWETGSRPGLTAYLAENGNLIRANAIFGSFNGPGFGGELQEYNWDGDLIWSFEVSNEEFQQHHDIEILPNGHILFIAWEIINEEETIANGSRSGEAYWSPVIYEIEKIGKDSANFVWEWHVWDHLIQDFDSTKQNFGVVSEHPELMDINFNAPQSLSNADWMHLNGVDYDPVRDEIILSARHTNEIYIIDHSTTTEEAAGHTGGARGRGGDFLYRWGNQRAYGMGSNVQQRLFGQHNAEIIPEGFEGAGNISIFNNGIQRPQGQYSSIEEITPPRDADGNYILNDEGIFDPIFPSWQYTAEIKEDFYSTNMGGAKRLENGNTLICESRKGRFFEVTSDGNIVWDYENPIGLASNLSDGDDNDGLAVAFRADKLPENFAGFEGKDLTPGDLLELEAVDFDCTIYEVFSSTIEDTFPDDLSVLVRANLGIEISMVNNQLAAFHIVNFNGKIIEHGTAQRYKHIDISTYSPGFYLIVLKIEGQEYVRKFIKS